MTKGFRFLKCPDCGKKGVRWAWRLHGEDNYFCRYCDFYYYTIKPAEVDSDREERLRKANPEAEL